MRLTRRVAPPLVVAVGWLVAYACAQTVPMKRLGKPSEEFWDLVGAIALSPSGKRVAAGSWSGVVTVWDYEQGTVVTTFRHRRSAVEALSFTPDGKRLISGVSREEGVTDNQVRVSDAETGTKLHGLATDRFKWGSSAIAVSPDGTWAVVSGLAKGAFVRIDLRSYATTVTFSGHEAIVTELAINATGTLVASACADETVAVWNAKDGTRVYTLEGHTDAVQAVAFSPSGEHIASASMDGTVRVWDARAGKLVHKCKGHAEEVYGVGWLPKGGLVVSCGEDSTLRLWNLAGRNIQTVKLPAAGTCLNVRDDYIAVGHSDGTVSVLKWKDIVKK